MTKTQEVTNVANELSKSVNGTDYSNIRFTGRGGWVADSQQQNSSFGMPEWTTSKLGKNSTEAIAALNKELTSARILDLETAINEDLAKSESQNDAATMHFNYDEENKTWCFSGETIGNLVWETDDMDAEARQEAIEQAIDYIKSM